MNNRGGVMMMSITVGIMIFITGMIFLNPIKDLVTETRASTNLDCSNAAVISDGTKLACLGVDIVVPYFIIIIISFSGGVIASRFLT